MAPRTVTLFKAVPRCFWKKAQERSFPTYRFITKHQLEQEAKNVNHLQSCCYSKTLIT